MNTKIVGVTFPNPDGSSRQQILKRMRRAECEYEAVYLEPEPDNPHDKNAVKVLNIKGEQMGYLSSDLAADILKMLSEGKEFSAVITSFTGGEKDKPIVGCNIEITTSYPQDKPQGTEELGGEVFGCINGTSSYCFCSLVACAFVYER